MGLLAAVDGKELLRAIWMIPGGEKKAIAACFKSLAIMAGPEDYAAIAVPLIKRDSRQSFADQVYASAIRAASQAQQAYLTLELERQPGQQTQAGQAGTDKNERAPILRVPNRRPPADRNRAGGTG